MQEEAEPGFSPDSGQCLGVEHESHLTLPLLRDIFLFVHECSRPLVYWLRRVEMREVPPKRHRKMHKSLPNSTTAAAVSIQQI